MYFSCLNRALLFMQNRISFDFVVKYDLDMFLTVSIIFINYDDDDEDVCPQCPPPDLRVLVTSALVTDSSPAASVHHLLPATVAAPFDSHHRSGVVEAGKKQRREPGVLH